jgi:hypothetical protein
MRRGAGQSEAAGLYTLRAHGRSVLAVPCGVEGSPFTFSW